MEVFILIISLMIGTLLMIVSNDNFIIDCIGLLTITIVLTIKEYKEESKHDNR